MNQMAFTSLAISINDERVHDALLGHQPDDLSVTEPTEHRRLQARARSLVAACRSLLHIHLARYATTAVAGG
jgi:hypothetical protein